MNRPDALSKATDCLLDAVAAAELDDFDASEWAQIVLALRFAERAVLVEVAR